MKQLFSLFLILAITLLNVPSQSEAAIIAKDAEAAVLAKDAEATEMMVSPGSNVGAQSSFYGVGFGVTNLGQDLWSLLKNSVETKGVNLDFEGSELVEEEGIGIEATAPVVLAPQAVVSVDEEERVAAPLVVTSAGTAAVVASSDAATEAAPVATTESTTQEDEALFPLLYGSSNAAGIAGAPVEGGFLSTTAGKLTAGALLIALALGIIIPFAAGGGGSGGSGAGQGSLSDPFVGVGAGAGSNDDSNGSSNPVPEPGTMLMLLLGGAGLMSQRKRFAK